MGKIKIERGLYASISIPEERLTLCGSTRFLNDFDFWETHLTLAGKAVYSVAIDAHSLQRDAQPTPSEKKLLDQVHFKKIRNSDAIFVVDVGGYIGESTRNEIEFAQSLGRKVYFLSREFPDYARMDCIKKKVFA